MLSEMTLNVQGAAATPWPDPAAVAAAAPQPWPTAAPLAPRSPSHAERGHVRRLDAPAAASPYEAMRLQAYRRDIAATVALGTQAAPATATASTASAPAVKLTPPPQVNPLAAQPDPPARPVVAPPAPAAIQAVAAVGEQAGARAR
jgi:hypothetical protein